MKKIYSLMLVLCVSYVSYAQSKQDTINRIEQLFERYKSTNPGCQLAISRNGALLFSSSWGMADLEHNARLTNESVIEAGSVSKQFTAAAILLLEQQGKLSLNDDVRKYIPELPDYGTPITLRQMMHHTSGLKDWGSIAAIAGWPRSTKTYTNHDALYIASRQKTLNNPPGAEYIYSNTNYNLFAVIVERVSGKSLADFTRINIFEPAGMKHTQWRDNFKKIVPNRAIAYGKGDNGYFTDMPNEYVYGNGGLLTTAQDLLLWNNFYLQGKLGNPSLLPQQLSTNRLTTGIMNSYAAGLISDTTRGWKRISHNGATASYRSSLEYFPDLKLSIAWLSNTSEFDGAANVANLIRDYFLSDISKPGVRNNTAPYVVSPEKLENYTGLYRNNRTSDLLNLSIKDGKLGISKGSVLVPLAENKFLLGKNMVEMHTENPRRLLLINQADTISYFAVDSAKLDEKALNEYTGDYYSEEAEAKYQIQVKHGKLIAHRAPATNIPLTAIYKDGFSSGGGNMFYFERDQKNQVAYVKVYIPRARNVEFKKTAAKPGTN